MNVSLSVVKRLKNYDEKAFDEVYRAYDRLIFYIINSIVKDYEASRDIMQESFIEMYNNIGRLRELKNFHSWFTMIARCNAVDYVRRESKRAQKESNSLQAEEIVDYEISIQEFEKILEPLETHIVILHIVHNLTFKRISEQVGFTQNVVVKKYYSALEKLRKFYGERRKLS